MTIVFLISVTSLNIFVEKEGMEHGISSWTMGQWC